VQMYQLPLSWVEEDMCFQVHRYHAQSLQCAPLQLPFTNT
jgi:hypothetical protein